MNDAGNKARRRHRHRNDPSSNSPDQNQNQNVEKAGTSTSRQPTSTVLPLTQRLSLPETNPIISNHGGKINSKNNNTVWGLLLCAVSSLAIIYYARSNAQSILHNPFFSTSNRSLRLPYLMRQEPIEGDGNLGGWLVSPGRHSLPDIMEEPNAGLADFGGLVFLNLKKSPTFQRSIRPNDSLLSIAEKESQIVSMNGQYISKRHWFDDELEDVENECQRPNWEMLHFPLCNAFHEIDLSRNYDLKLAQRSGDSQAGDSFYLSHGYFRDVFALNRNQKHAKAVLKVARYTKHEMNYRPLFNAKRDAIIMERLSGFANIVDIYGHCGSSVMVESLPHEVEVKIVPGGGWKEQSELNDKDDVDIANNFTVPEKLYLALEMASSIAVLHGFEGGVIVHDDIQLCQWLRNDDFKLKLGDFNRARVLAWNQKTQEYCEYDNGHGYGNYRSPEEYGEKPLLEKHDVWSFGNNLYALLTGLWIFYENTDDEVVSEKIVNGTTAFIDDRYRKRSYIEGRMVELVEKCWTYERDKRITIFEAVDFLRDTVKEHERRGGKKK